MKNPVLLVLLMLMLAPRLVGAAMPHALACAGMAEATTINDPHHDHQAMMHGNDSSSSEQRGQTMPVADSELGASIERSGLDHQSDTDNGNCQHCDSCDDHCSALLVSGLPQLTEVHVTRLLAASIGRQATGIHADLNRPPRFSLR